MAEVRSLSVERLLANYCAEQRFQFLLDGVQEPAIRVLSPESFLPLVVMEAEMAAYELLASGFRRIGLDQLPPIFPMGSKLVPDDESMFGVYARVRPIVGDGLGSLKATVFSLAMLRVFGVGQVQQCECNQIYERYTLEWAIARQIDALNQVDILPALKDQDSCWLGLHEKTQPSVGSCFTGAARFALAGAARLTSPPQAADR